MNYLGVFVRRWLLPALALALVLFSLQKIGVATAISLGGSLLVGFGILLTFNLAGTADAVWRFWTAGYSQFGMRPRANPRFVRLWFGGLMILIGAVWILSAS